MQNGRNIPAGLRQETPIAVTMRFHQESGEAINRVCGVRNTAGLNLAYAIGAKSQESVSKTYTDAANCDADSSDRPAEKPKSPNRCSARSCAERTRATMS